MNKSSSSSSDRIDSRGPLCQLRVATTTSLGPFSTNAEGVYHRRSAGSMNGAGVLAVDANQDQNGSWFLLLRPVIMCGELACGHRVSPHGQTMNFVSRRWHPEHRATTSVFLTKSCQCIPRIIHWERMWKTLSFRRSSCRSVHVSEPYNKMDSILVWYKRSFVCSWSRVCRQIYFIECMAVEAMPMQMNKWRRRIKGATG